MTQAEELLADLDPEQREVAEALRGPVQVLAGAGTGKTRAITHRIAYGVACGVYEPTEVLAVTFTTRAAGEMRGRLRTLGAPGVQARTFHSAALRQLRYFWPRTHGRELPRLTESKLGLLASAARRQRVEADQALLRDLASEVEWAKVSNVHPDEYAARAPGRGRAVAGMDATQVAATYAAYEEAKREADRMDMEDVLLFAAALLAEDEQVAARVRSQYRFLVVDEFQDVSPLQHALLGLWLGEREELCVVGDPAQTIYTFAGADACYLRDFPRRHPEATRVELTRNYRSTPAVVAAANALVHRTPSSSVELRAVSDAERDAGAPAVAYTELSDEVAEAEHVATRIEALRQQGTPYRDMAVLFRVHARSEAFEEALVARGVPYAVRGTARFFDRPEVREAVTMLRGTARGGPQGQASGAGLREVVRTTLAGLGWTPTAPEARGQTRDRWESWQALVEQGDEHAGAGGDLAGLVDELDRRAAEQHAPVADGVTLATLHAAKGLEWDAVFVTGVQQGTIPLSHAETPDEVEEERRLLYVAMTRARRVLEVCWATARHPGGRATRSPSGFLDGLRPERSGAAAAPRERRAARRRQLVHCRECGQPLQTPTARKTGRCPDCPASYDEELFARLREWRRQRAEQDQVPAFVVFTDATLQLIAEYRPTDEAGLLQVSGVGRSKLDRFGKEVLALVAGAENPAEK